VPDSRKKAIGRPRDETERTATTLRLDSELYDRVVALARKESRPLNRQIEVLLRRALERER
jgi:hypothetical protein